MPKILVVEDDWNLNQAVSYALEKENYSVCSAHSIAEAKSMFQKELPCLILLDVNLPDGEGFSFCKWILAQKKHLPILFLTARDLEEDVLTGYELGAQDYITKPFSIKVLQKKIHVILNRTQNNSRLIFEDGYLKVDFDRAKTEVNGQEILLTPTELRLLKFFLTHKGKLLTYSVLLEEIWDKDGAFVDKHTLAVNINRLRGKIEDMEHKYISNIYGMGYQWLD